MNKWWDLMDMSYMIDGHREGYTMRNQVGFMGKFDIFGDLEYSHDTYNADHIYKVGLFKFNPGCPRKKPLRYPPQ